jgi:glycosyltransferase involved in cell wall biosynthesis
MSAPLFSVIVCTYNRAALLPRALDSLLAQQGIEPSLWEVIVVDDGSTDGTEALVHSYMQRHSEQRSQPRLQQHLPPHIRYHAQPNQGTGAARTQGIALAAGDYVTFLDSDDEYLPEHLASRKAVLERFAADGIVIDLLHGGLEVIGDPFVADKDDPAKLVHLSECVAGGTFFIRRQTALALGGFGTLRYADDAAFFAKAEAAGARIAQTTIPSYRYYRTTADSLCTNAFTAAQTQALEAP